MPDCVAEPEVKKKVKRKCWIFVIIGLVVICFIPFIYFYFNNVVTMMKVSDTDNQIIASLNTSVFPCKDFYEFSCENFNGSSEPGIIGVDNLELSKERIQKKLQDSIVKLDNRNVFKPFKLVKNLFDTCLNEDSMEKRKSSTLLEILDSLGGWPVLKGNKWSETAPESWEKLIYDASRLGIATNSFINIATIKHPNRTLENALAVMEPSFGLSPYQLQFGLSNDAVKHYYEFMVDVAIGLGINLMQADVDLQEVINYEVALAKIFIATNQPSAMDYDEHTVASVTKKWPKINWKIILKQILEPYNEIHENDTVIIKNPTFISYFEDLITETSQRTKANYILWKFIEFSIPYLNKEMRIKMDIYKAKISGTELIVHQQDAQACTDIVRRYLQLGSDALYLRKNFHSNKNDIAEMANRIEQQLVNMLVEADWVDKSSRKGLLEKTAKINMLIGYTDELFDSQKLQEYYSDLELTSSDYLKHILNITSFQQRKSSKAFRKNVQERIDWTSLPSWVSVTPTVLHRANTIIIPAGLVLDEYYRNDGPKYFNYGKLGSIIGHQLYHILDDTGRFFDGNGKSSNWWTDTTATKYNEKSQCFIDQYNNYLFNGQKVNGTNTWKENVADAIGLRAAYLAYKEWVKENGPEPPLSTATYTPQQLFWISHANTRCTKESNPKKFANGLSVPNKIKLIGALNNIPEFIDDFVCDTNHSMKCKTKCSIW